MKYALIFLVIFCPSLAQSQTAFFCSNSQFGNKAWCYQQVSFDELNTNQDDYLSSDELQVGDDSNQIKIGQMTQSNEAWIRRSILPLEACNGLFSYYDANQNGRLEKNEYERWQTNMDMFAKEKSGWHGYDPLKDRYVCLSKTSENSDEFSNCIMERYREDFIAAELFVTTLEKKYHVACYKK